MHYVTTLAEDASAFHACRAATHYQHRTRGFRFRKPFRMPATAVFLTHGLVLRTHDLADLIEFRYAYVASDAFTNVLQASLFDLFRQERIGDRRPRCADKIQDLRAQNIDHVIRTGEPPVTYDGNIGAEYFFSPLDEWSDPARLAKPTGTCVFAPFGVIADLQRYEVDHALLSKELENTQAVFIRFHPLFSVNVIHFKPCRDGATIA